MKKLLPVFVSFLLTAPVAAAGRDIEDEVAPIFPTQYKNAVPGVPEKRPYWEIFDDPILNQLVEEGLSRNYDLKAAAEQVVMAQAAVRKARSAMLPSVSAQASYYVQQFDSVGTGLSSSASTSSAAASAGDSPFALHSFSPTLNVSYTVDITGKNYLTKKAAAISARATEISATFEAQTKAELIVDAYFAAAAAKVRLEVVEGQIATSEDVLGLVEAQFGNASATAIDVLQQQQQVEALKGNLPLIRMSLETNLRQLAVLLGEPDVSNLPEIKARLPEVSPLPATGTPERLLKARPDLRAASKRIRALVLEEKAAFRTLLPTLSLGAEAGYQVNYSERADHGEIWNASALLSIPLYSGGANRAALSQVRAETRSEIQSLRQSALNAMGEVEAAVLQDKARREYLASLKRQVEISKTAFEQAKTRYAVGLSDNYLDVLTALSTHQSVQLTEVEAALNWIENRIALLNALGGEWTEDLMKY